MPVRERGARAGARRAFFDGTPTQVAHIRTWCQQAMKLPADQGGPVLLTVSELASNAVRHTASGGRFGRVEVGLELLPGKVVLLSVTDDGPRVGRGVTLPQLPCRVDALAEGGRGLRLVDAVAEKWWWSGEPGRPLTVWALIDPDRDTGSTVGLPG
ncbi:ATP-binding protein [Nocardiopsis aegyptia]|nr:ATP-binding protein [Nocardiopsis aegyptia]